MIVFKFFGVEKIIDVTSGNKVPYNSAGLVSYGLGPPV
jgi:hypothetical protein